MSRISDRLEAISSMSLTELGSEWERLYKEPTPTLGADLLSRSIAYRLQERQYGGLTATARRQIKRLAKQMGCAPSAPMAQI